MEQFDIDYNRILNRVKLNALQLFNGSYGGESDFTTPRLQLLLYVFHRAGVYFAFFSHRRMNGRHKTTASVESSSFLPVKSSYVSTACSSVV